MPRFNENSTFEEVLNTEEGMAIAKNIWERWSSARPLR